MKVEPAVLYKEHWRFIVLVSLASAGVGFFWGVGAQELYASGMEIFSFPNGVENPEWLGGLIGAVLGLAAGICYTLKVSGLIHKGRSVGYVFRVGFLWAMLAGLVCSTLVHVILIICYRNLTLGPIALGAIFGVIFGAALGLVGTGIFVAWHRKKIQDASEQNK